MIKRYSDHAANERTFLAWVRTAVAVMAFGFLIEKFDLFMSAITAGGQLRFPGDHRFADAAGLAFILLGVAMIAVAGFRFFRIAKEIDRDDETASSGSFFDLVLALLLFLLGLALFLYLGRVIALAAAGR